MELRQTVKESGKKYWFWVLHNGVLEIFEVAGWHPVPFPGDTNYINEGELKLIQWLIEELRFHKLPSRYELKLHATL